MSAVAKQRQLTYGFTAEQIVGKLLVDPSAANLVHHFLKETNAIEVERLMVKVLPDRYLMLPHEQAGPDSSSVLNALSEAYAVALGACELATKVKAIKKYVTVLKEQGEDYIAAYDVAFVRNAYLEFAEENDRALIISHLLAQLKGPLFWKFLQAVDGLGDYLHSRRQMDEYFDPLIRMVIDDSTPLDIRERAKWQLKKTGWYHTAEQHEFVSQNLNWWQQQVAGKVTEASFTELREGYDTFYQLRTGFKQNEDTA